MTRLDCARCGQTLYTSLLDYEPGDTPRASELVAAAGVKPPMSGDPVQCPACGSGSVNMVLKSGERVLLW